MSPYTRRRLILCKICAFIIVIFFLSDILVKREAIEVNNSILIEYENFSFNDVISKDNYLNTYYLDSQKGNDNNNGTSPNFPWKTITKVSSKIFYPGDRILFKRGLMWNCSNPYDWLRIRGNGNITHPIIISAYGEGHRPIINGKWIGKNGINIDGQYINVEHFEVKNANGHGIAINPPDGARYNDVYDCIVHDCNGTLIVVCETGGNNVSIRNCHVYGKGNTGISLQGSPSPITNTLIENCTANNLSHGDGINIHRNMKLNEVGNYHIIRNNTCYNNDEEGIDLNSGTFIIIEKNQCYGNTMGSIVCGIGSSNIIIRNNYFHDDNIAGLKTGIMIQLNRPNILFHNNLVVGFENTRHIIGLMDYNDWKEPENVRISHNTIISLKSDYSYHSIFRLWDEYDGLGNITIDNNIIIGSSKVNNYISFVYCSAADERFVLHNNYYFGIDKEPIFSSNDKNSFNFSYLQTIFKQEKYGKVINPNLYDISNLNYSLESCSPAIDNGHNESGLLSGEDFFENPIYGQPDKGAIEYQPKYQIGKDPIDITSGIRIYLDGKYRYASPVMSGTKANLSLEPISGWPNFKKTEKRDQWMDIKINTWNLSSVFKIKWTESNYLNSGERAYIIGNLISENYYYININNFNHFLIRADKSGSIKFNLSNSNGKNIIEINEYNIGVEYSSDCDFQLPVTGEPYTLRTFIKNENVLKNVKVNYWFDNDITRSNVQLGENLQYFKNDTWECTIDIPINATYLEYYYTSLDVNDLEQRSHVFHSNIIDNLKPEIIDNSPKEAFAGSIFDFDFQITDNIGLSKVVLEYWFDGDNHINNSLIGNKIFNFKIIIPNIINNNLFYIIHAYDIFGNHNYTNIITLHIIDTMVELVIDHSPSFSYTGDEFLFDIQIKEFDKINQSYIIYWYENSIKKQIVPLIESLNFEKIDISYYYIGNLYYQLILLDYNGTYRNSTIKEIKISDNDPPVINWIDYPKEARCGEDIIIFMNITDNSQIEKIVIEYWDNYNHIFKAEFEANMGYISLIIPNYAKNITFILSVKDIFGNIIISKENEISIIDDKRPILELQGENGLLYFDDKLTFSIIALDNIGICDVFLEYLIFGENEKLQPMVLLGDSYIYSINLSEIKGQYFRYRFNVTDTTGNYVQTNTYVFFRDEYSKFKEIHVVELNNSNTTSLGNQIITPEISGDTTVINSSRNDLQPIQNGVGNETISKIDNDVITDEEKNILQGFIAKKKPMTVLILVTLSISVGLILIVIRKRDRKSDSNDYFEENSSPYNDEIGETELIDNQEILDIDTICEEIDDFFKVYEMGVQCPSMTITQNQKEEPYIDDLEPELQEIEDILNLING